eukprot:1513623-Amphidinium_carterae.1
MQDIPTSAHKALGKRAGLRRSAPFELMAYGGPASVLQVTADFNTILAAKIICGFVCSARRICQDVADKRADFQRLETCLAKRSRHHRSQQLTTMVHLHVRLYQQSKHLPGPAGNACNKSTACPHPGGMPSVAVTEPLTAP